jgi:hypothetical protein
MRLFLTALLLLGAVSTALGQPAVDINKKCSQEADARSLRGQERVDYRTACKERLGRQTPAPQPITADGKTRAACLAQMRALNPADAPSPDEPAGMSWIAKCMARK